MKYIVNGVKLNQYTQDKIVSMELSFDSYVEANNKRNELIELYPDMTFTIDYNSHISIDEMLTLVSPKMDFSKWN